MRINRVNSSVTVRSRAIAAPPLASLPKAPERQRGLWSFLTWSFFLSQVAGKSFFPGGAYAAQDDYDGVGAHATTDAETTYNDTPRAGSLIAGLPEGAEDQDVNFQHTTHLPHSVLMLDVPPAAPALGGKPSTSDAAPDPSGGGGGGGGSDPAVSDASPSDGLEEGLVPAIGVTSTPDENLIVSSGLDPHPDQMVLGLDANGSASEGLGLEVHTGTTGILLAADVDLAPVLNPDHLVSDVGLTIGGNLNEVLGFDLRLSGDGIFVGTDIDLSQVASAALTLDMAPSSTLTATANVIDVLGFDARMDVPGLAGVDAIGEAAKGTLAEVTGIHLFGDSGSLTAQLMNNPDGAAKATVSNAVGVVTSGSVDGVASEPAQQVAQVMFDASGLIQTGDVSSGDAIKLTAQTLSQPDELFSGNSYTDYHVTLQTQNLDGGRITGTHNTSTIDTEALSLTTDAPHHPETLSSTTSPPSTIENVAPSAVIEQATESLAQNSTTLPHLTLH
jgi:hypothetical protein